MIPRAPYSSLRSAGQRDMLCRLVSRSSYAISWIHSRTRLLRPLRGFGDEVKDRVSDAAPAGRNERTAKSSRPSERLWVHSYDAQAHTDETQRQHLQIVYVSASKL